MADQSKKDRFQVEISEADLQQARANLLPAARSSMVRVRLSPVERDTARRAAAVNHQSLGSFLRDAISSASAECLELEAKNDARKR